MKIYNSDVIIVSGARGEKRPSNPELSSLQKACLQGDEGTVETYLRSYANVNDHYSHNIKFDLIVKLVSSEIIIDLEYLDGFTALHFAVLRTEPYRIMKLLLEHGADINAVDAEGRTPLHIACALYDAASPSIYDHVRVMEFLIENGSDLSAKDRHGNTPLMTIFDLNQFISLERKNEFLPIVNIRDKLKCLIKHEVDVTETNSYGDNILHIIIENASYLHLYGCELFNLYYDYYAEMLQLVLRVSERIDMNAKNDDNLSPLEVAITVAKPSLIKVLLDHGADLHSIELDVIEFDYPDFTHPNLDFIQDLISMLELLSSYNFEFSWKTKLEILKFIAHEDSYCHCAHNPNFNEGYFLYQMASVLNHASPRHAYYVLDKFLELMQSDPNELYVKAEIFLSMVLLNYSMTRTGGIYGDRVFLEIVNQLLIEHQPEQELLENCQAERKRMESIILKSNKSLAYLMSKSPYTIYEYVVKEKSNFMKIACNFKVYGDVIKGHVTQCLVRRLLETSACDFWVNLTGYALPFHCCQLVFSDLTNENILNICIASL
ncbi:protein fem-1 homolog C-like [Phymastichus coffea]|uniref:protein fem-1 homolog C-like n=1 Tax=Phymastichus coffea TaxID=108790 RepID=UPI00273B3868|nr:protein fem-1 homolog C-like [Phymastichus coffea]XP_058804549.1 protein fem-1 homolog C-like [Phymastichus coffea]